MMRMRKVIAAFLTSICVISLLSVCVLSVHAQSGKTIFAETDDTVRQGEYGYVHVYIDDLTAVASLNVSVHYDPEKIGIVEVYNQVECKLYDSSDQDSSIQFSYIFDGEENTGQTELFYFRYQVLKTAPAGGTYFDILVGDACDSERKNMEIQGSRCSLQITDASTVQTCNISTDDSATTAVQQEFTIHYNLSNTQIASGSFVILYDPELFACVDWTSGEMLRNMLTDVNTDLSGAVYVSFAGTSYAADSQLGSITFRTLKNVTTTSSIQIQPAELYDLNLNPFLGENSSTTVRIQYDANAVEPSANMIAQASYDPDTDQVLVAIRLSENAHLGAGDFMLNFDPSYLQLNSLQKEFLPDYFMINDKKVQEGQLKFSVISLTDIVTAETVLTLVFDTTQDCSEHEVAISLTGSRLSNALTEGISLNFVSDKITIPAKHHFTSDCDTSCSLCEYTRAAGDHMLVHHEGKAATCVESGWDAYDTCQLCDYSTYREIPIGDHSYGDWYYLSAPSCTQAGTERHDCKHCEYYEERIAPPAGHVCTTVVTAPTCTEEGYTTYTCSVCGHCYTDSYTEAQGHHFGVPIFQWAEDDSCTAAFLCADCSEVHTMDATVTSVTVPATATEAGSIVYTAEVVFEDQTYTNIKTVILPALSHIPGDVNGDGKVTQLDVTRLRKYLAGGWDVEINEAAADVNGDGKITQLDVTRLRKYLTGGWDVTLE